VTGSNRTAVTIAAGAAALAVATILIAILETWLGLENGSTIYLVAVSAIALRYGTWPAVGTAIGAFLAYNFLFLQPRLSFAVANADELLMLFMLLFVGIVIGRLAGAQRAREQDAHRREHEARALFGISRELVRSDDLGDALRAVSERLVEETGMDRVWIGVGATVAQERTSADTAIAEPRPVTDGPYALLQRDAAEGSGTWVHLNPPGRRATGGARAGRSYRVELRAGDDVVGSLWARRPGAGEPSPEESRLLAATADQVGAALRRERLQAQASEVEIARRSDELKSALVDSVSHDLRTPLATIRAAAGSLADPEIQLPEEERREVAARIDAEADRLSDLVGDLLDMSRIQSGMLVPQLELFPLADLVEPAVERTSARSSPRPIIADIPEDLPPVRVDGALLDRIVSNLLDNAVAHAPAPAPIRVCARPVAPGNVALTVEDGGPGVPAEDLDVVFDRFRRLDRVGPGDARRGFGLGLAVVRGLTEAMGGSVRAERSELGGLAVTVTLPADAGTGQ
jgi:two-component system sensor histidine kinase KdpD